MYYFYPIGLKHSRLSKFQFAIRQLRSAFSGDTFMKTKQSAHTLV